MVVRKRTKWGGGLGSKGLLWETERLTVICPDLHERSIRFILPSSQNLFLGDHLAPVFNTLMSPEVGLLCFLSFWYLHLSLTSSETIKALSLVKELETLRSISKACATGFIMRALDWDSESWIAQPHQPLCALTSWLNSLIFSCLLNCTLNWGW